MKKRRLFYTIDKALSQSFWKQLYILAGIFVLSMVISYVLLAFSGTDWCSFCERNDVKPWLLPIYLLIDSNALNNLYMSENPAGSVHGWMLVASSLTYLLGIFIFNGLLIGVITNYIEHRVQDYREGLKHYLKRDHHIIMGYDDMVPSIIADIFKNDPTGNVMILTSYNVKQIKERLKKSVLRDKLDQIIVNYGQKTASEYFKDIHLEAAKDIFVIGYRQLPSHDAVNVECVDSICSYLENIKGDKKPKRIVCLFEDIDTYAALKTSEIFARYKKLNIEIIPYNFYAGWARQVFVRREYREKSGETYAYPPIYGEGIGPEDKKNVHMVVVGSNNFASTMAMEAAHLHHFPNFEKNNSFKTRITFIDLKADQEMPLFFTRNRHFCEVQSYLYSDMSAKDAEYSPKTHSELLSKDINRHDFLDVEFEFIKGDVFSENIQNLLKEWALDKGGQCLSIFLAMTDQRDNFIMGMNMPDEIYENKIPIFIRQERADSFVTNLRNTDDCYSPMNLKKLNNKLSVEEIPPKHSVIDGGKVLQTNSNGRYAQIYPFGMEDMAYCFNEKALRLGKLINYIYSFLYETKKEYNNDVEKMKAKKFDSLKEMMLLDHAGVWKDADSQWKNLSVANRWSNFYFADNLQCKIDTLKIMRGRKFEYNDVLTDEEVHILAVMEHNRWNVEKLFMGFRVAKPDEDYHNIKKIDSNAEDTNKKLFIHSDICPFDDLPEYDKYQNEMTARCIPWIMRMMKE